MNPRLRQRVSSAAAPLMQRAHRPDYKLVLFVGLLMLLGLVIMYAIGPQRAHVLNSTHGTDFYTNTYFVGKQTISLIVGVAALIALAVTPLSYVRKHAGALLLSGLIASMLLFLFGNVLHVEQIVQCSLGACRWFELGPLGSFQPAELLKFGVLIFLARFMAERISEGKLNDWDDSILPIIIMTAIVMFFVVFLQKDMGTGIALVSIISSMLLVGGIDSKIAMRLLAGLVAFGVLMILVAPHRVSRVMTFLQGDNPQSQQVRDDGYHIRHAKIAIGSGGLMGVGIGNSVQATGYLPEAINDSVFAILGETFGFVGLVIVLGLFTALLLRILSIANRLHEPWLQLLVAGVFGWVGSHVILNIASMTGVFPLTGITLPLLSFGGTSMIFIAGAIGIVFNASRYTAHERFNRQEAYANINRGRGIGRTRHAGRRRTR